MPEIDQTILTLLRERGEWVYGLEIASLLNRPTGVILPCLARLERGGLIESKWENEEAPPPRRRVYRATGRVEPVSMPDAPDSAKSHPRLRFA